MSNFNFDTVTNAPIANTSSLTPELSIIPFVARHSARIRERDERKRAAEADALAKCDPTGKIAAASEPQAKLEKACFTGLPAELKLVIWELATPGPRVIYMYTQSSRRPKRAKPSTTYDQKKDIGISFLKVQDSHRLIPTLLHVDRFSRAIGLQFYTPIFTKTLRGGGMYFNYEQDTLYFQLNHFMLHHDSIDFWKADEAFISKKHNWNKDQLKEIAKKYEQDRQEEIDAVNNNLKHLALGGINKFLLWSTVMDRTYKYVTEMRALENLTVWEPIDLRSKLERFIEDDSGLSTKNWILKGLLTDPDNEKEKARLVQIEERLAKNSGKYFLPKNVILADQEVEYVGKSKVGYFPEISTWTPLNSTDILQQSDWCYDPRKYPPPSDWASMRGEVEVDADGDAPPKKGKKKRDNGDDGDWRSGGKKPKKKA